jgi:hypothetical protein
MVKMKILVVTLVFLLAHHPAWAAASQKTISFQVDGQKVVGTLEVPDGAVKPAVILLLHGFKGSRNELEIPSLKEGVSRAPPTRGPPRGSPVCGLISGGAATVKDLSRTPRFQVKSRTR